MVAVPTSDISDPVRLRLRLAPSTSSGAVKVAEAPRRLSGESSGAIVVSIVLVVSLAVAAGIWYWRSKASAAQIESIAVIPFTNAGGNADTDFLSDGLTESLIASLAHVPAVESEIAQLRLPLQGQRG